MRREVARFVPLLLLYIILVIVFSSGTFQGDEYGYIRCANRLVEGHFSPRDDVQLWWGPGYPIVLTPFVLLGLPWFTARLQNAFFLFGAVVYFYRTVDIYIDRRYATIAAFVLGLYPPFVREIHLLYTENLVFFLMCGFMFHYCRWHRSPSGSWGHLLAASIYLGYLALKKVFFGYVILVGLVLFGAMFLRRRRRRLGRTPPVFLLALIWCLPYLVNTYSLTGKVFYWGTSGGMSLYWMSTSYPGELGDWHSATSVREIPELAPHRDFFDSVAGLSQVAADEAFKKQAVANIIDHPSGYAANWVANIGRLLFSYPYSFTPQKLSTYFYIVPTMFIVVLFALSLYPAYLRRRTIPYELWALLAFALTAFIGSSLLSAYERMFAILVPILLLWLAVIYLRTVQIGLRPKCEVPAPEK